MRSRLMAGVAVLAVSLAGLVGVAATTATAAPTHPIGSFDGVSIRFDNIRYLSGWASDPAAPGQPVTIYVYSDDYFIGVVHTGDARPDVASAVPGAGPSAGWHFTTKNYVPSPNPMLFCAYAVTNGGATKTPVGCRAYALPPGPNPNNPLGALDTATASPGLIRLQGWAGDPDGDPTTQLRVFYDGQKVMQGTAGLPRPDVRAALGLSPTTGYDLSLPITAGTHVICVYAQNTGNQGTQNATVGCATRTITWVPSAGAHDPRGNLDAAGFSNVSYAQNATAPSGWAYDPDAPGPLTIQVRALGHRLGQSPNDVFFQTYSGPTGSPRPDVQSTFPAAGPNSGFSFAPVNSPDWGGVELLCAYAVNTGPGSDGFLGCKQQ